ncbi:hypothetical protein A2U01_0059570, partial [Trifolium medium]|nr:hypothetical protein [Trifolium medium]
QAKQPIKAHVWMDFISGPSPHRPYRPHGILCIMAP